MNMIMSFTLKLKAMCSFAITSILRYKIRHHPFNFYGEGHLFFQKNNLALNFQKKNNLALSAPEKNNLAPTSVKIFGLNLKSYFAYFLQQITFYMILPLNFWALRTHHFLFLKKIFWPWFLTKKNKPSRHSTKKIIWRQEKRRPSP